MNLVSRSIHLGLAVPGILCGLVQPAFPQSPPRLGVHIVGGYPSVSITGAVSTAWAIQFTTNLPPNNLWLPLASLRLSTTSSNVLDNTGPVAGAGIPSRYYRAVSQQYPSNVVTTNMIWISPGTFMMGSPGSEADRVPDEVQHAVTISKGFFIGKYLVATNTLSRPFALYTWDEATNYCGQLTQSEQLAGRLPSNWVYRLPTESEWEFACRAGTTTAFSYGDDPGYTNLANYAWYSANSGGISHNVGLKLPNPWGLYDVHGNVFEWCQDWYGAYPASPVIDPQGPPSGAFRVFRGGSWAYGGSFCRSAGRYEADPSAAYFYLGFRVVAAPVQ